MDAMGKVKLIVLVAQPLLARPPGRLGLSKVCAEIISADSRQVYRGMDIERRRQKLSSAPRGYYRSR